MFDKIKLSFGAASVICVLLGSPFEGSCVAPPGWNDRGLFGDPLVYSDLVVEGVVVDLSRVSIPYDEWFPIGRKKGWGFGWPSSILEISLTRVIRGMYEGPEVSVWAVEQDVRQVALGDTVVFALFFRPDLGSGVYTLKNDHGLFRKKNGKWQDHHLSSPALTYGQIEDRAAQGKIEHVIARAEVIVSGTIVSIEKTPVLADDGQLRGELERYVVEVDSLMKGDLTGRRLSYYDARGGYHPDWQTFSTHKPAVGERWYLFLRGAEPGYVLCWGVNSRFKIVGDQLMRFGNVPYQYSRPAMDQRVREEVEGDEE